MLIHPLAAGLPRMSDKQFAAFKADIRKNGLDEAVWTLGGLILDGRHRARACDELGIDYATREYKGADPHAFVISQNYHRRHMTTAQRRALLAAYLKKHPEQSNARVAANVGVSDKTVAAARTTLEIGSEIPNLRVRVGSDGVGQAATKRKPNGASTAVNNKNQPRHKTAKEVAVLLAAGHNVAQISEQLHRGHEVISELIREYKLMPLAKTGRIASGKQTISAEVVIRETVNAVSATSHGLRLIQNREVKLDATEALELAEELREAMVLIRWLDKRLQEIINGDL